MKIKEPKLLAASLLAADHLRAQAAKNDLSVGQLRALLGIQVMLLGSYQPAITLADLREAAILSKTRLRDAVSGLVAAGLVARRRGRKGRHEVALTIAGRITAELAAAQLARAARKFLAR